MDQILVETSEMPPENVLEGLCKNRLQGSEQNQTVFSMYNLELSRDRVVKAIRKLKNYEELVVQRLKKLDS